MYLGCVIFYAHKIERNMTCYVKKPITFEDFPLPFAGNRKLALLTGLMSCSRA